MFRKEDSVETIKELESKIKVSFSAIKEEMEDHLEAINENTNELQSNYEYMCELDAKIEKLNEKIEQLTMSVRQLVTTQTPKIKYFLTYDEQKVFIILYTLGEQKGPLSLLDIAIRMNSTELLVKTCIKNMQQKGVPINLKKIDQNTYFLLDSEFKELQTKENVLNIDESLIRDVLK